MSLTGKIVFVESLSKEGAYYNGEYFVLRETPAALYGVKLSTGYGCHEHRQLPKAGKDGYAVIQSWDDDDFVRRWIRDNEEYLRAEATAESRGGKRQWIGSVYSGIETNIRAASRALSDKKQAIVPVEINGDLCVSVPRGTKRILLNWE